jgi:NAD(P)-dependent dehydrogenase (short-subunit alcohol dehydrogenase family)
VSGGDPFRDRVAVVTGGASGIGAAMARAFAARGAKLVLADIDEQALSAMEEELRTSGHEALGVPTDVSRREDVEALARAAEGRFGAVHIICNNAGIATFGEIATAPREDWDYTMAIDFWGVAYGIQTFVPRLLAQGQGGHVVNTASMAGLVGMQWLGIYSAAKFAVVGVSEALHRELRPRGIGVSVLCPMVVDTRINENSERLRPGAFRPSTAPPPPLPQGAMQGSVKDADDVARRVVRAITRNQLYVLTHEEQREILRRRAARLDAVFEPESWDPEGGS